jgi:hypothetical protein
MISGGKNSGVDESFFALCCTSGEDVELTLSVQFGARYSAVMKRKTPWLKLKFFYSDSFFLVSISFVSCFIRLLIGVCQLAVLNPIFND